MMYKMERDLHKIKAAREGACVERTHTFLTVGPQYTNGFHTFNMLAMLRILWPNCSKRLIWAVLEHDLPERWIGDSPYPAKAVGILDREVEARYEAMIIHSIFGEYETDNLSEEEKNWLKGLDLLEFWFWMLDERSLGNHALSRMFVRVDKLFRERAGDTPTPILNAYYESKNSEWEMMPDIGEVV